MLIGALPVDGTITAGATTGAVFDQISRAFQSIPVASHRFIRDYHDHPRYIHALAKTLERLAAEAASGRRQQALRIFFESMEFAIAEVMLPHNEAPPSASTTFDMVTAASALQNTAEAAAQVFSQLQGRSSPTPRRDSPVMDNEAQMVALAALKSPKRSKHGVV